MILIQTTLLEKELEQQYKSQKRIDSNGRTILVLAIIVSLGYIATSLTLISQL